MKHVYHYLISNLIYIFIIPAILLTITHISNYANHYYNVLQNNHFPIVICLFCLSSATIIYLSAIILLPKKVYLLDFACYKHEPRFLASRDTILEKMSSGLSPESIAFCAKVMEKSGVCENIYTYGCQNFPYKSMFVCGREEVEIVVTGAVGDVLAKTGVDPRDIGVVIVNISTFNPVPSVSAMIVNRFKLREDLLSYNLGGMGCSAGVIAVDLAKRLLQVQRNTYALIMSLECPTSSFYAGNDKSKLLSNCLFRMGGTAIILSNRPSDRRRSKYELKHTLRTHLGSDDRAYNCVIQDADKDAKVGVSISKDLMAVAGVALRANITALGPLVLPVSEQLRFASTFVARKVLKMKGVGAYVPDFKLAFEHFCIHAGGKTVLDEVEKKLRLTKWDMEPSRMTLYRYSNTSSSSLWYELAYAEAKGRIRKGDRVWQIGFGSGFKCASGVWCALKTINPADLDNPWTDVIHQFPVTS
ncbi:3-ketoacyl-coa synthase 17 [Phtheirospermum japonicum]|uniref:3-ketoacyl-CoA synthase n=1 Tax=Phtheirospermum japonicum TaxID=374723 RepID=A0A830C4C0_9LAMI|nr:3-ketoacyl-coa synthase 17 [Phtheirospermum japonicum]